MGRPSLPCVSLSTNESSGQRTHESAGPGPCTEQRYVQTNLAALATELTSIAAVELSYAAHVSLE